MARQLEKYIGPSKPQLFHPHKGKGNSFRMCIHDDIGKEKKHQKKTWKKKKQLLDFFRR